MNILKSKRKKNVMLLPSDKSGEFCCRINEQYITATMNHLNRDAYKQVRNIKVEIVEKKINSFGTKFAYQQRFPIR